MSKVLASKSRPSLSLKAKSDSELTFYDSSSTLSQTLQNQKILSGQKFNWPVMFFQVFFFIGHPWNSLKATVHHHRNNFWERGWSFKSGGGVVAICSCGWTYSVCVPKILDLLHEFLIITLHFDLKPRKMNFQWTWAERNAVEFWEILSKSWAKLSEKLTEQKLSKFNWKTEEKMAKKNGRAKICPKMSLIYAEIEQKLNKN